MYRLAYNIAIYHDILHCTLYCDTYRIDRFLLIHSPNVYISQEVYIEFRIKPTFGTIDYIS